MSNTITVTSKTGVRFNVRVVEEGEAYGATDSLTADRAMVEFYDTRYPHTQFGQFVSRYHVETIINRENVGLDLNMDIPDWKIDAEAMSVVVAWLREQTSGEERDQ